MDSPQATGLDEDPVDVRDVRAGDRGTGAGRRIDRVQGSVAGVSDDQGLAVGARCDPIEVERLERPLASPHRAANWRGSVDDQPRACSQHRPARLSLQASAREGLAETRRGLGQAAQNDARFGGADRKEKLTQEQWSPDQISGRLAKDGVAFISHERIYQHVWKDKKDGGTLYLHLRHSGKKYNRRKGKNSGRGLISQPRRYRSAASYCRRKKPHRDWEADTIIGANHKGVVMSHVERTSKYTKLAKLRTPREIFFSARNLPVALHW